MIHPERPAEGPAEGRATLLDKLMRGEKILPEDCTPDAIKLTLKDLAGQTDARRKEMQKKIKDYIDSQRPAVEDAARRTQEYVTTQLESLRAQIPSREQLSESVSRHTADALNEMRETGENVSALGRQAKAYIEGAATDQDRAGRIAAVVGIVLGALGVVWLANKIVKKYVTGDQQETFWGRWVRRLGIGGAAVYVVNHFGKQAREAEQKGKNLLTTSGDIHVGRHRLALVESADKKHLLVRIKGSQYRIEQLNGADRKDVSAGLLAARGLASLTRSASGFELKAPFVAPAAVSTAEMERIVIAIGDAKPEEKEIPVRATYTVNPGSPAEKKEVVDLVFIRVP